MLRLPGQHRVKHGAPQARTSRLVSSCLVSRPRNGLAPCRFQRAAVIPAGRLPVACRATSWLLEGPAAAAQDVGELLLRRWVGLGEEGHLAVHEVSFALLFVQAGWRRYVFLCVVVYVFLCVVVSAS